MITIFIDLIKSFDEKTKESDDCIIPMNLFEVTEMEVLVVKFN